MLKSCGALAFERAAKLINEEKECSVMNSAKKGDWVQIHQIVLKPGERAPHVPEDTKKVPLELWVKGTALHDAKVGEEVEIETATGRKVRGVLTEVNPRYKHDFGEFVPELLKVDKQLKEILFGGGLNE